jgi:hypothetical protein
LEESAHFVVKNIGKPCAEKLHARFDGGGQGETCSLLFPDSVPPGILQKQFVSDIYFRSKSGPDGTKFMNQFLPQPPSEKIRKIHFFYP